MKFSVLCGFWSSLLCLCWSLDTDVYVAKGGTLHLRPGKSGPFTNVVWSINRDLVAEWDAGKDVIYYGEFKHRTTLNTVTGDLQISDVGAQDVGNFTLELNKVSQANTTFSTKIISPVPQPQIHVSPVACSKDSDQCKLHCAEDTSQAGPVTYHWTHDPKLTTNTILIDVHSQEEKSLSCVMKNPISEKESEPFTNPFYQEKDGIGPGGIAGLVIMILVVVVAAVVLVWYRKNKRRQELPLPTDAKVPESVPLDSNTTTDKP
ncbi:SLAM family member 5 [Entelurus aequoreus]|uniref:SLAM family member 5 n=1 Tax=Entelurus aequoreus TaxID=161455 RepID=UPI002B1DB54E|nr:SLAM family member 5 [Entelurus aequoreus]